MFGGANPSVVSHGGHYRPRRRRPPAYVRRPETLAPGTVVGVSVWGVVHEGIITDRRDDRGHPFVVSKSKRRGRVAEEPYRVFCNGRDCWVIGYPSAEPADAVIGRARRRIGERWSIGANCQHFTRECHGHRCPRSPGLNGAGAGLFAAGALAAIVGLAVL